jgi:excisionase family DNA binding protein
MNAAFDHPKVRPRRVTPRLVVTIRETAKQLGVTELTVRRHIKKGKLHAIQIGGSWRIPIPNSDRIEELPEECNLHQIANSLDVSDLTVRRWIKSGQFPATKRDRMWIVARSDLEELLASGTEGASPAEPCRFGEG